VALLRLRIIFSCSVCSANSDCCFPSTPLRNQFFMFTDARRLVNFLSRSHPTQFCVYDLSWCFLFSVVVVLRMCIVKPHYSLRLYTYLILFLYLVHNYLAGYHTHTHKRQTHTYMCVCLCAYIYIYIGLCTRR
jgi:hypothetical protein